MVLSWLKVRSICHTSFHSLYSCCAQPVQQTWDLPSKVDCQGCMQADIHVVVGSSNRGCMKPPLVILRVIHE